MGLKLVKMPQLINQFLNFVVMSRGYKPNRSKFTSEFTPLPKTKISDRGPRKPQFSPRFLLMQSLYACLKENCVTTGNELDQYLNSNQSLPLSKGDKLFIKNVFKPLYQ